MSIIKFSDGSSHFYHPDGKPQHDADLRKARKLGLYPSITTIDKAVFINPALDRYKQEQIVLAGLRNPRQPHEDEEAYANRIYEISGQDAGNAADFGQKVHKVLDNYPEQPSPELLPWFAEFDSFYQTQGFIKAESEAVVLDHDIGVAGRLDFLGFRPDKQRIVLDFKTQRIKRDKEGKKNAPGFYRSWVRQLAFYAVCDAKKNGTFPSLPVCASVVMDSTEPCPPIIKWWTDEQIKGAYKELVIGAYLWCMSKSPPYFATGKPFDLNPTIQLP